MNSTNIIPKALSLSDLMRVESYSQGKPVCTSCFLITRNDRVFFCETIGKTTKELSLDNVNSSLKPVPDEHIFPLLPANFEPKIAPEMSNPVFIKRSGLESYTEPGIESDFSFNTAEDLLNEALIMHKISANGGHQNIVKFHGLRVHRGRITGIVLKKHERTLKQCLESDPAAFAYLDRNAIISGLQSAVTFLHNLKLAHNDISPYNVMIDEKNQPVLIDFGSCGTWGQQLQTCGTKGFSDQEFCISKQRNDFLSLNELRGWMKREQDKVKQMAWDVNH